MRRRSISFRRSCLLLLTIVTVSMAGAISSEAQSCGLVAAGYFDNGPKNGLVGMEGLVSGDHLNGITASAINLKSKKRYVSVPVKGGLRFFGDVPEGTYRVTVGKIGYKTTIYDLALSCDEAVEGVVSHSVRLWKGNPKLFVREVIGPPDRTSSERLPIVVGNTDTNSVTIPPRRQGPVPRTVSGGVLNGNAVSLPKPAYPPAARAVGASGAVTVQVLIDEEGRVVSATATGGHPLLQAAAVAAARQARFTPTLLEGQPVKVSGIITYNFVP